MLPFYTFFFCFLCLFLNFLRLSDGNNFERTSKHTKCMYFIFKWNHLIWTDKGLLPLLPFINFNIQFFFLAILYTNVHWLYSYIYKYTRFIDLEIKIFHIMMIKGLECIGSSRHISKKYIYIYVENRKKTQYLRLKE